MNGESLAMPCAACGASSIAQASFCSQCGYPLKPSAKPSAPKPKWYYNPWFVLLMLSPVTLGPFGLPLLWKSGRFSTGAKWALSLLTVAWTGLFVWYVMARVIPAVTNEFNQLNATLQF